MWVGGEGTRKGGGGGRGMVMIDLSRAETFCFRVSPRWWGVGAGRLDREAADRAQAPPLPWGTQSPVEASMRRQ